MGKVEKLINKKLEMEKNGCVNMIEYIRCMANINYFRADKNESDYLNIKIFFINGIEAAYGNISSEITDEVIKALDLIFAGDFKGFCLMNAIIAALEKVKEQEE